MVRAPIQTWGSQCSTCYLRSLQIRRFIFHNFTKLRGGKGKVKEGNSFDKSVQADRTEKMHGVTIWRVSRVPSLFPQPSFSVDLPHQKLLERQFTALQFEGSWS